MVNQNSASAAEIGAACLQDHGRALVAGQRSYGKGTVQQLVPLESGRSLLKLTWASFWRPSGANIHRMPDAADNGMWGVRPDPGLELALSADEYAAYRRYRNQRDLGAAAAMVDAANHEEVGDNAELTDRQLQNVIEYLQRELEDSA